jgi:hypothetical protein
VARVARHGELVGEEGVRFERGLCGNFIAKKYVPGFFFFLFLLGLWFGLIFETFPCVPL